MMEGWKYINLGDIIHIKHGYGFKGKYFVEEPNRNLLLTPGNFAIGGGFKSGKMKYYDGPINDEFVLCPGDVIVTMTDLSMKADTLGYSAKIPNNPENTYLHNQRLGLVSLKTNEFDLDYIYWLLRTYNYQKYIAGSSSGATVKHTSPKKIYSAKLLVPESKVTQKRIADILSAYDDLIENNLKRIKLLEQAAQNIYKEWFVNMRFPGYENTPINEETGLPVGWEEKSLGDIISKLESGSRPKGGIDKSLKEGVPSIGAESVRGLGYFDFSKTKYIKKDFFKKMRKGILEDRDILIYKDGAYIGRSTLFQDNFPFEECSINEHIFLIHAKDEMLQYYLYLTLHSYLYFEKMQSLNSNAAQPGINQKKIKTLPIICPSSDLLIKFDSMVKPMVRQIYKLAKMNLKLKTGRDILLPRLMNRTIEV